MTNGGLVSVEYLEAYNGRAEGAHRRVDPTSAASLLRRGVVRLRPDGEDPATEVEPEAPAADPVQEAPAAEDDPEPEF